MPLNRLIQCRSLQAQEELQEYFEGVESRVNFNLNNKSQVLQSPVEDSKFPKEANQESFLERNQRFCKAWQFLQEVRKI